MEKPKLTRNIYRFILAHSFTSQVFLIILTLLSFPFLYYSLELPKLIVNEVIGGVDFPKVFYLSWIDNYLVFDQISFLITLSILFLVAVCIFGLIKMSLNISKGKLGEQLLVKLRQDLFSQLSKTDRHANTRLNGRELIPMLTSEIEPVGGFIGDMIVHPLFQGGTLCVYLGFILMQDLYLGLSAIALYPFQLYVIPKMQEQVNLLARQRIKKVRELSNMIGETVLNLKEIHLQQADIAEERFFSKRLYSLFQLRYSIFKKKFFVKFLNNFLAQVTPFLFFLIGGYRVLEGEMSFGSLVAVLAAYKDLASPWKELLKYYQQKEDIRVKYEQVVDYISQLIPIAGMAEETRDQAKYSDDKKNGVWPFDTETLLGDYLDRVAKGHQEIIQTALLSSQKIELFNINHTHEMMLQNILRQRINHNNLAEIYPKIYMPDRTILEQITFGDAHIFGNEWMNQDIDQKIHLNPSKWRFLFKTIMLVGLSDCLFYFGLLQKTNDDNLQKNMIILRRTVKEKAKDLLGFTQSYDHEKINDYISIGQNIFFGSVSMGSIHDFDNMDTLQTVLKKKSLDQKLHAIGIKTLNHLRDIFKDTAFPTAQIVKELGLFDLSEWPYIQNGSLEKPSDQWVTHLALRLVPAKHRFGFFDQTFFDAILQARHDLMENPDQLPASFIDESLQATTRKSLFWHEDHYDTRLLLMDNVIFGPETKRWSEVKSKLLQLIKKEAENLGIMESIIKAGVEYKTGDDSEKLTDKQKIQLLLIRNLYHGKKYFFLYGMDRYFSIEELGQLQKNLMSFDQNHPLSILWCHEHGTVSKDDDRHDIFDVILDPQTDYVFVRDNARKASCQNIKSKDKPVTSMGDS